VLVVGGGNTAVEEAIYLANIASQVLLVHRRGVLRAEKILQERLFANKKIDVMWNYELDEVTGIDKPLSVTGANLKSTLTGEIVKVPVEGVFIAIGHEPQSELFKGQIEMKPSGYIITKPHSTATSVPGVYAAGDVADDVYRQAVTARAWAAWRRSRPRSISPASSMSPKPPSRWPSPLSFFSVISAPAGVRTTSAERAALDPGIHGDASE
jgi:thioredoxin reductase (NADPH)